MYEIWPSATPYYKRRQGKYMTWKHAKVYMSRAHIFCSLAFSHVNIQVILANYKVTNPQFLCFSNTTKPISYIELSPTFSNKGLDGVLISSSMDIHTDPEI